MNPNIDKKWGEARNRSEGEKRGVPEIRIGSNLASQSVIHGPAPLVSPRSLVEMQK